MIYERREGNNANLKKRVMETLQNNFGVAKQLRYMEREKRGMEDGEGGGEEKKRELLLNVFREAKLNLI